MLATILRRALNNRLQPSGWKDFGRPLIADKSTPILQLGPPHGPGGRLSGQQIEKVWVALNTGNKSLLVRN